ncbi:MAG: Nif3-like dinuclear metal center hexameric protein [Bacteroidales bacterium]|nr:Nif3-like dinuclear metal center hexameric protein [Bacteroidales bacterium]
MKIKEVITFLDNRFHPEYQEDYDNSGFLVGDGEAECTGVLVALDLTSDVLREAERLGMNLIVTHHPFIFGGLKRITDRSEAGRMVMDMVRQGVATYAAHTNLDNLPDGVNGILCKKLGLVGCTILKPITQGVSLGAGMVGELEQETSAEEFLRMVKERLSLPWIRLSGNRESVKKVAVCGGSGAFLISDAINSGADVYLTADLKYHDFQRTEGRMLLADIGHYESEQFAKEIIYNAILEKFCNFACRISECQQSVVHYI